MQLTSNFGYRNFELHMSTAPKMMTDERAERASLSSFPDIEFQLRLKSLYEYLDSCHMILDQIQSDLSEYYANPANDVYLRRAAERLGKLCIDADSWGFDAVYEVAHGVQMLLLNLGERSPGEAFRDALTRGLNLLSALLQQCEIDFQWRMAVANTLEYINQAGH